MKHNASFCCAPVLFCALTASGQQPAPEQKPTPIYHVTVIERTTPAVNYAYRSGPTTIGFRGTVVMPEAHGQATVESKRGRTEIEARFERLKAPSRFGPQYLTYTLWAITPEGAAHNIGELVPNSSDKAKIRVTTDLQTFGLVVTAEPYSASHRPSGVVVLENEVRPETVGKVEDIRAQYELLPREAYTWEGPNNSDGGNAAPKVSMREYEALLSLYEAQNAAQIARSAEADRYAADTFEKAERQLNEARRLHESKAQSSEVVRVAREAMQTAEDARAISVKRQEAAKVSVAEAEVLRARQAQSEAAADVQRARAEVGAAREEADVERSARERAEARLADERRAAQQESAVKSSLAGPPRREVADSRRNATRLQLLQRMDAVVPTRDTPRGLVATVPDSDFTGADLRTEVADQLARLAAVMGSYPGLRVDIEGYTDGPATTPQAWKRAEAVCRFLVQQGLASDRVTARGLGDSRPLGSNESASGRGQNRRVEIVVSGDSIGALASWDQTYRLSFRQ